MRESERYVVVDGCMFLNKSPTKMCLAKKKKKKGKLDHSDSTHRVNIEYLPSEERCSKGKILK